MSSFDCYKQLNVNRGFGQVIMSNLAHDSLPTKFDDKHLFPGVLHIIANNLDTAILVTGGQSYCVCWHK